MTEQQNADFSTRVERYQRNHKKGLVFQAEGTLGGMKAKRPRSAWRGGGLRWMLRVISVAILVKVGLFHIAKTVGYTPTHQIITDGRSLVAQMMVFALYPDPVSLNGHRYLVMIEEFVAGEVRKAL